MTKRIIKFTILLFMSAEILHGQNIAHLKINLLGNNKPSINKVFVEKIGYGIVDSTFFYSPNFDIKIDKRPYSCYQLLLDGKKTIIFFIENENIININIDFTNAKSARYIETLNSTVNGGVYNEVFKASKDSLFKLEILRLQATTTIQEDDRNDLIYRYFLNTFKNYPFVGMVLLYDFREALRLIDPYAKNIKKYISLVESLEINLKKHPLHSEIRKTLDSLDRLNPGGTIYDFSLINLKKKYVSTFDKRGKFLLLLFTIQGCPHEDEGIKEMIKRYEELKTLNFEVLRVSRDFQLHEYNFQLLQNIDGLYNYPWESVYLFNNNLGNKIIRTYNLCTWKKSFLYSPDGILIEANPDIETILKFLKLNKK